MCNETKENEPKCADCKATMDNKREEYLNLCPDCWSQLQNSHYDEDHCDY